MLEKSLSLVLSGTRLDKLDRLLSELYFLEDFHLNASVTVSLNLSSQTIKRLKLVINGRTPELDTVGLFLPSLELLDLELFANVSHINGEVPLLRRAVIAPHKLRAKDVTTVAGLLNCISHVEESLCMTESVDVMYPIHILFEPKKDVVNFLILKHLDVIACFHKHNFEDVMTMLNHSPALESLNLVHKIEEVTYWARGRKKKDWTSKLPRNADGNYRYADFRNLHLEVNRKEFMKWISKKHTSKRKTYN